MSQPETFGVFANLHLNPIFETSNLAEATQKAETEFKERGKRVWVLNQDLDICAYVDQNGTERF